MVDQTRRTVLSAVGTGVALSATGAVGGAAEEEQEDAARVVHFSPDAPTLDIHVENEVWFESVEALTFEEHYMPSEPGTYDVAAVPAGESREAALVEAECVVEPGPCTLAVVGEVCAVADAHLDLIALKDDFEPTEQNHARVRMMHASPDAPMIDVRTENGTTIAEGISFGETATVEVPADETVLVVSEAEGETIARFPLDPEAGHVYSAFGAGYLDVKNAPEDAEENSFSLAVMEDASPGER